MVSGMDELNKESWRAVAKYNNLPPPDDDHLELAMGAPLRPSPSCPALPHAPPSRHPAATSPTLGDASLAAAGMLPERAIQQTFMWTDDWGETKRWSAEVSEAYARMLPEANFTATPGAVDWLTALNEYQVPCVVCTSVARAQVVTMLEKAGLSNMFQEARPTRHAHAAPRARPLLPTPRPRPRTPSRAPRPGRSSRRTTAARRRSKPTCSPA